MCVCQQQCSTAALVFIIISPRKEEWNIQQWCCGVIIFYCLILHCLSTFSYRFVGFFVGIESREQIDRQSRIKGNSWTCSQLLNLITLSVKVRQTEYFLTTIKFFTCLENLKKSLWYFSNCRYTWMCISLGVCVCMCVWYQETVCLFYISNSLLNTKDKARPNMIAFNVSHKSLTCVRMPVCIQGRAVFVHT